MIENASNVWSTGYLPNGRKVSITAQPGDNPLDLIAMAIELDAAMTEYGITVELPGLESGEKKEQIVTVMRREKPSDGTPIIDFYPEWKPGGDEPFGTYKFIHLYLNADNPQMTADFLQASGFKSLEDIPLYDGQSPLKRTYGRKHPKETAVPTPFSLVKKQGAEKIGSDDKPYRPWELVRYENSNAQPAQQQRVMGRDGSQNGAEWRGNGDLPHLGGQQATLTPITDEFFPSDVIFGEVTVSQVGKAHQIQTIGNPSAYSYTRQPFRDAGIECGDWDKAGRYPLAVRYVAEVKTDSAGKLQIVKVKVLEDVPF